MKRVAAYAGLICGALTLLACRLPADHAQQPASTSLQALLGSRAAVPGFARALAPRPLRFPADHGPHPRFRTEWWYYTGNLRDAAGRPFGFELTVFRFALTPQRPAGDSPWRANQVYMADFAVSDIEGHRFHAYQRLSRGALGLAGAQAVPFRVWVDDWSVASQGQGFPWRLRAHRGDVGLSLSLKSSSSPGVVLNGDAGLSRKGPAPGDASFYYSMPRLSASGELRLGGHAYAVTGDVWMDHEWSTSALAPDQVGWDWFGLRLDDGSSLMFYRLRDRDGRKDRFSAGTWVAPDGRVVHLPADAVAATPTAWWRAPGGARYPVAWRLSVPSLDLALRVRARLDDQLLPFAVRYWEGAVAVAGTQSGRALRGDGYLELTGYAKGGPARH
ncbi:lipocalin-like domain-containing protein [Acidihalobacter prosperus]|uniref:AttH domain-containing protein n=1 Tax=Acidihalobacter prosperus TaxID=160660 RepID=A0A1A6C5D6_9GAMM|nr:lipocalin-like domain-containing protein [Acidihalobacter prosperus]OBS09773.1 hypothetical protein Thpro_020823 [Acidihalobacter prosperus]